MNTAPQQTVVTWLLEEHQPSLRYRTLTKLLERDQDDPEVAEARRQIPESQAVSAILAQMHPEGYWLQTNPRTKKTVGESFEYGAFATTHFCLAYLAELGVDRSHPQVAKAADRYLNLQQPDGDFWNHYSCLFAYNIRTFVLLGYRHDPRVQKTIDLMLRTERPDGGYLCDMHEGKYKTKATKSCIRGSGKALLAFAMLPEYWEHPRCLVLVDYFLRREGLFTTQDLSTPANKDVITTRFPITWRTSPVEILYALSRMGYGKRKEFARAWQVLESKHDAEGRYILDWNPQQAPLKPGKRGQPNKWLTLYALLALKYCERGGFTGGAA